MEKLKKERDLMREALRDLDAELKGLRASKEELEDKLGAVSSQLDTLESQKIRLRDLITLSMKKEAILLKKKNSFKEKLVVLDKKIQKVQAIERELKEEI